MIKLKNKIDKFFSDNSEVFYTLFRVIVGLMFMMHGLQKFGVFGKGSISGFATGMGFPIALAYAVALVELLGGLMIAVGLFTRCASIATSIVMISALSIAHFPKGWSPLANGGELAVMYLVSFIMMLGYGPGKFSLDYKLFRK